jgi:hypothetical protein
MHDEVSIFPLVRDLEGDVHGWELGDRCVRSCGQHQRTLILIYPSIDRASWSPSQSLG